MESICIEFMRDNIDHVVNTTPHIVTLYLDDGRKIDYLPDPRLQLRLNERSVEEDRITVYQIPVMRKSFYDADRMPEPMPFRYYIVSLVVKNHYPTRSDFLVPDEVIFDKSGNAVGCRRFSR